MIVNNLLYGNNHQNMITIEFDKHRKIKKRVKSLHTVEIEQKEESELRTIGENKEEDKFRMSGIITYDYVHYPSYLSSEAYKVPLYYNGEKVAEISISVSGYIREIILNYKLVNKYYDANLRKSLVKFIDRRWNSRNLLYSDEPGVFSHLSDLQHQIWKMKMVYKIGVIDNGK